ncbi:Alcohol dehydrogenase transcription factor Myb/SANT-like [Popillia japonica]|uniref:Alcohol dehydrogenase transcription factor Myb/SANT-like n=1 Tax=Popillia japonica TaxID=7064 RepID=A0AAW1JG90_POPJA
MNQKFSSEEDEQLMYLIRQYPLYEVKSRSYKDATVKHNIWKLIGKRYNTVTPVAQTNRRIPFHLRNKVEIELNRLLMEGIIEKATEPTNWISDKLTEQEIRKCIACQATDESKYKAPLQLRETLNQPFIKLDIDYAGPFQNNKYAVLLVDEYSRYQDDDANRDSITDHAELNTRQRPHRPSRLPRRFDDFNIG